MFRERGILLDLYEDEKIVAVIRRHWISFVPTLAIVGVLILAFFIGSVLAYGGMKDSAVIGQITLNPLVTDHLAQGAYIIFGPIYLLGVLAFFYVAWLDYYLDVFILTNKRILRFEQLVLFGQNVSETSFQHVQDVSSQVKGLLYTLLNVGTVYVETAGENENFSFITIKDPGGVATEILELQKNMWDSDKARSDLDEDKLIQKMEEIHQEEVDLQKELKSDRGTIEDNKKTEPQEASEIPDKPSSLTEVEAENAVSKNDFEGFKQELKEEIKNIVCDVPVAPVIERKEVIEIVSEVYKDGRQVTSEGVIWQADQEITHDILSTLNEMEK